MPGKEFARLSAAEHYRIEVFRIGHIHLLRSNSADDSRLEQGYRGQFVISPEKYRGNMALDLVR